MVEKKQTIRLGWILVAIALVTITFNGIALSLPI